MAAAADSDPWLQPNESREFYLFLFYTDNGQGVPRMLLTPWTLQRDSADGGHQHSGSPGGSLTYGQTYTGESGYARFIYQAGAASHRTRVCVHVEGYEVCSGNSLNIGVTRDAWTTLDGCTCALIGSTGSHPSNHHAAPAFRLTMLQLASDLCGAVPVIRLPGGQRRVVAAGRSI